MRPLILLAGLAALAMWALLPVPKLPRTAQRGLTAPPQAAAPTLAEASEQAATADLLEEAWERLGQARDDDAGNDNTSNGDAPEDLTSLASHRPPEFATIEEQLAYRAKKNFARPFPVKSALRMTAGEIVISPIWNKAGKRLDRIALVALQNLVAPQRTPARDPDAATRPARSG